jgi:hypothetical protein
MTGREWGGLLKPRMCPSYFPARLVCQAQFPLSPSLPRGRLPCERVRPARRALCYKSVAHA